MSLRLWLPCPIEAADRFLATYHGDDTGQRHSPLTQITPSNVSRLAQVWRFQTGQNTQIKASPILVNGILYVTTPDNLWAIDARTGRQLWHYASPMNNAFHIGHRGVAVYKDYVYVTTPDAHLIALNANDGVVRWNVVVADSKRDIGRQTRRWWSRTTLSSAFQAISTTFRDN